MPLPKSTKHVKDDDEIEITSPSIVSRSILQALINANNASSTPPSLPFSIPLTNSGMFTEDKAQRKLLLDASLLPAFTEGKARILQTMRLFARRIVNAHSMNHSIIHVDEPGYSSSLNIDIPRIQHDLNDLATRSSMLHAFLLKSCVDSAVFALNQSAIQPTILGSSPLQRPKIRGVRRLKDKDKVMNGSSAPRRADRSKAEREVFKPDAITVLVDWFKIHITSPYPSDDEKLTLCEQTGLTRAQLQAWFVNARGRRWKKLLAETKQEAASGQTPSQQQQASKPPTSSSSKQKKIAVKSERDDDATSSDSADSDSEYKEKSTRNKGKRERRSKHNTRKRRRTAGSSQPTSAEQEHDNSHDQTRTEQIVRTSTFTRRTSMNAGVLEQLRLMPGLEPAESIGSVSSSYSSVNHSIDRTLSRRFSNSVNLSIILHGQNHTSTQFPHVDVLESPTMSGFNEFSACHQFGTTQSFTTFNTTQTIGRTIQKTASFTVNQCHPSDNANIQNGQNNDWKMWSPLFSGSRGIFPLSLDGTRGDALPIVTADWRSQA